MTKTTRFLMNCSVFAMMPVLANAAGTYYTGNTYQPAQARYGQSASYTSNSTALPYTRPAGYTTSGFSSTRYNNGNVVGQRTTTVQTTQTTTTKTSSTKKSGGIQNGFHINGGITHENAMWSMEMKESASKLHYDDVAWNVLDLNGKYVFDMGSTKGQIEAGFKYGMQWGESSMVDDDITNGGFFVTEWWADTDDDGKGDVRIGDQVGHALSVGTSEGGNMLGFNVGFGLPGVMQWGGLKITPSVGYRYLKYKLETKKNYGLSVDTAACFTVPGSDEIQCDPVMIVHYKAADGGGTQVIWREDIEDDQQGVSANAQYIDTAGTYYYQQPGVSHSYEVAWSGPYLALDMLYDINENNAVDARIELGFPGYSAEGDQPYRFDWQHPKSVSDSAGMFSAFHLGLGANWMTAISDGVSLSIGVTYDYYNVSGADAETYLSGEYYTDYYKRILAKWEAAGKTETDMLDEKSGDPTAINIKDLEKACPGWVCKSSGEIESFYRSLGVRVGLSARF